MGQLGSLAVNIVADTKQFDKAIKSAGDRLTKFSAGLTRAGTALTAGLTVPLVAVGAVAVSAASELAESMNAVEVVFGDAGKVITDFAKTAASEVGLSAAEINGFATTIGSQLQNIGFDANEAADQTVTLTKRAADMASVFNTEVSEALAAIQSGLRGEADPLEKFGVTLTAAAVTAKALELGLADVASELTANQLATARLTLLYEQTEKVAGDFANTSGSLANQQKKLKADLVNLSAELGAVLVPLVTDVVSKIGDLTTRFSELDEGTKRTIVTVAGLAAGLGPLLLVIGKLVPAVRTLFAAFTVGAGPIGLIAVAIAGVVAGIILLTRHARKNRQEQEFMAAAVEGTLESVEDYETALETITEAINKMTASQARSIDKLTPYEARLATTEKALEAVRKGITAENLALVTNALELNGVTIHHQDLAGAQELAGLYARSLSSKLETQAGAARMLADGLEMLNPLLEAQTAIEGNLAAAVAARAKQLEDAAEAFAAARKEQDDQTESLLATQQKEEDLLAATQARIDFIEEINEAVRDQTETEIEAITRRRDARLAEAAELGVLAATAKLIRQVAAADIKAVRDAQTAESDAASDKLMARIQADADAESTIAGETVDAIIADREELSTRLFELGANDLELLIAQQDDELKVRREKGQDTVELEKEFAKQRSAVRAAEAAKAVAIAGTLGSQLFGIASSINALIADDDEKSKKKQAEIAKAAAVFTAIINTATAVTNALTTDPTGILAIIVGALGAAQVALIAATPLPLREGGIVAPRPGGTLAQIGEGGSAEAVIPLNDETLGALGDQIAEAIQRRPNLVDSRIDLTLTIGEDEVVKTIARANRDGRFLVDQRRGIARRR